MTEDLGFDAAIDYKNEDVGEALDRLAPDGFEMNFENVGGDIMMAVFNRLKVHGRMAVCGLISSYNATKAPPSPARESAWSAPTVANNPYIAAFKGQLSRAKAVPKAPEWERIVTEMQIVAERMVRGEFAPAAAAAEIDKRVDRLLEKRRWMIEQGRAE